MISFIDNNVHFECDDSLETIIFTYKGITKSVIPEESRQKILNLIREKRYYKSIICTNDIKLVSEDDILWIRKVAVYEGMKYSPKGMVCLALVFNSDAYSIFMAQMFILNHIHNRNKIKYFNDMERARKWLSRL